MSLGGWLLVGLIVLISAVLLALGGLAFLLTEHLRVTSLQQNQTKAIYLAQAGVMQAIYDVRFSTGGNGFIPGTYDAVPGDAGVPGLADDDVFILEGVPADFLLANMIPALLDQQNAFGLQNRDRLRSWRLRNVRADAAIRIDYLTVSWPALPASPPAAGTEEVARVEIDNARVWPTSGSVSCVPNGTKIDIANVTIPAATERVNNTVYFCTGGAQSQMPNKAYIELKFWMSDNTTRLVRYTPALATRSGSFTIKSVGEVRQGVFPFVMRRRLQAEYRLNQANPTDLQQPANITSDLGLLIAPSVPAGDQRPGYQELN